MSFPKVKGLLRLNAWFYCILLSMCETHCSDILTKSDFTSYTAFIVRNTNLQRFDGGGRIAGYSHISDKSLVMIGKLETKSELY